MGLTPCPLLGTVFTSDAHLLATDSGNGMARLWSAMQTRIQEMP